MLSAGVSCVGPIQVGMLDDVEYRKDEDRIEFGVTDVCGRSSRLREGLDDTRTVGSGTTATHPSRSRAEVSFPHAFFHKQRGGAVPLLMPGALSDVFLL